MSDPCEAFRATTIENVVFYVRLLYSFPCLLASALLFHAVLCGRSVFLSRSPNG